ncbi:UNVERIFIED_CONTAM: hypothetical protein HDU68_002822 [Siphonaria sp. JEL0065]|nr:hypothetical protein HDU68_002822 [Siphonaria sp. JEL0065]
MVAANDTFKVVQTKTTGRVYVESPTSANPDAVLTVTETRCFVSGAVQPPSSDVLASIQTHAVVGLISLCFGRYLLIATGRKLAATIQAHKIWRITTGEAVRVGPQIDLEALKKDPENLARCMLDQELLRDLVGIINSGHLYYSPSYDLTHSLQHNNFTYSINPSATLVDDRYFFNRHLMQPLLDLVSNSNKVPWITKIISGYAGAVDIPFQTGPSEPSKIFTVALLSRTSTARLGTRYIRRGLDLEGNASNSVEMEQIVFNHDYHADQGISSFVQLRGSAPVLWAQQRDLAYQPTLVIADLEKLEVWAAVEAHLSDLRAQYTTDKSVAFTEGKDVGKVLCVNLLNDDGREAALSKAYETAIQNYANSKIIYEDFPINKWCRKMNYANMRVLVNRVNDTLVNNQVFIAHGPVPSISPRPFSSSSKSFHVSNLQTGVARVSCLDSLDRTNITCTLFARHMLPHQLLPLAFPAHQKKSPNSPVKEQATTTVPSKPDPTSIQLLDLSLKTPSSTTRLTNLWSDSGDAISLIYAGTRALRSDITRTGKRTSWIHSSLDDGINSLTRYYLNNLRDGRKQDAFDVWTGKVASKDQIWQRLGETAEKRAKWLTNPVVEKGKGIAGRVVPGSVVDAVEPLLQETRGFLGEVLDVEVLGRVKAVGEFGSRRLGGVLTKRGIVAVNATSMDDVFGDGSGAEVLRHRRNQLSNLGVVDVKKRTGLGEFLVSAVKIYAPEKVTGFVEFSAAMVALFYVGLLARLFGLNGGDVVDRPRLRQENRVINELMLE